jgi:hypothetical protein
MVAAEPGAAGGYLVRLHAGPDRCDLRNGDGDCSTCNSDRDCRSDRNCVAYGGSDTDGDADVDAESTGHAARHTEC